MSHLNPVILCLGTYFLPFNVFSNNKKRNELQNQEASQIESQMLRLFSDGINEQLAEFQVAKASYNIGSMELNEMIMNSIPNRRSNQVHAQGFDF